MLVARCLLRRSELSFDLYGGLMTSGIETTVGVKNFDTFLCLPLFLGDTIQKYGYFIQRPVESHRPPCPLILRWSSVLRQGQCDPEHSRKRPWFLWRSKYHEVPGFGWKRPGRCSQHVFEAIHTSRVEAKVVSWRSDLSGWR